jgi:hypothetical protein
MKIFKKKKIEFNNMLKRIWGVLIFVCFLFIFSSSVSATVMCDFPTCGLSGCGILSMPCFSASDMNFGEDTNFRSRVPAPLQGSVQGIDGNLAFSEVDASLSGRGLDISVSRTYNSNIYGRSESTPEEWDKLNLLKPGWLGYGWNFNMGKIKRIESPSLLCDELNSVVNTENLIIFPDGSVSRFIYDTENKYNERKGSYLLDNQAKVNYYNLNLNYNTGYYEVIGRDGTKYIFNHHVPLGDGCDKIDTISGESAPWTDSGDVVVGSNSYVEQHKYPGVYLTKIIDPWGNYIEVEYYHQKWRNPNDESAATYGYNDASHPVSWGSPFIKKITDTMGREIMFEVTNSNSINGKLDYIEYDNVNENKIRVDYIYSGETGGYSSCYCEGASGLAKQICEKVCFDDSLLVEVKYLDEFGDELYPSTKYDYDVSGSSTFKLSRKESRDKGITEYVYDDFEFIDGANNIQYINSLAEYTLKSSPSDPGLVYEYDYFDPNDAYYGDWMRSVVLIGPADESGKKTMIKSDYLLQLTAGTATYRNLEWRYGIEKSKTIAEATDYDDFLHEPFQISISSCTCCKLQ